ncbi:TetR/AcrR family transcriptional regulator [Nocardioides sp. KC13]|uniref:TetR/AcrR family transcriptional regulator n=1 Tax=Nocardioides turkmenicus TaxID=2711220 RepID=A0A6M1QYH1_9ACTN|nr:TetR/AcrR family transcriptional regulator [Nocardioides sp. KC13]NGN92964.1 TetR/AcrR family transcriptional regulator [Nocardioides sp. KC13]
MSVMAFNRDRFETKTAGIALARTIGRDGLRAPTLKVVAEEANMCQSTLHKWFAGRENMLPHAAAGFAGIYWEQIAQRVNLRGWSGYLPSTKDEIYFLRAWLGIEELARSNDVVGEAVRDLWHNVRFWLRSSIGRDLTDFESGGLVVLLRGLWDGLCSAEPIDPDLAQQIWTAAYAALRDDLDSAQAA